IVDVDRVGHRVEKPPAHFGGAARLLCFGRDHVSHANPAGRGAYTGARMARARPMVTANQVTFGRLCAIPLLCVLLYGGHTAQLVALVLGIAVGFTDLLDGYLARKYGATVLGGLLDPI